jgi:DNA-directed RNA polymerase specialized sigma24 family protein
LRVVMNRVAIDVARGMRENVAARTEHRFRWITTVELDDLDPADTPDVDARVRLHDVLEFLHEHAQPDDIEMLRRVVQGESWSEIAARHGTTASAARQRVRRLRLLLESWQDRPRSSRLTQ